MMQCHKALACGLAISMAGAAAYGINENEANPFQKIVDRNVFGLKPPPPPPTTEPPKAPTPKITFTGTITWNGKKRALLKTPPPAPKPGEQPKGEQYYIVEAGGQDREIEVLEIDDKAGTVKIRYSGGEPITLNYVDNGAKPIAAAPAMVPGQPGFVVPQPGAIPPPPTGVPSVPGTRPLPTRTLRLPTPTTVPGTGYNPAGAGYVPPAPQGSFQINRSGGNLAFNMASPSSVQQSAPQVRPEPELTGEQQHIIMELQREQNRNNPTFPPLPPTPLTPKQEPRAGP